MVDDGCRMSPNFDDMEKFTRTMFRLLDELHISYHRIDVLDRQERVNIVVDVIRRIKPKIIPFWSNRQGLSGLETASDYPPYYEWIISIASVCSTPSDILTSYKFVYLSISILYTNRFVCVYFLDFSKACCYAPSCTPTTLPTSLPN